MEYPVTATVELSPAKYIDFDIGRYVGHPPANDEEKLRALKEPWTPRNTFKLPVTGKKNLSYQRHWTTRHSWLVYSNIMQGAFCKICVLLGKMQGGCGHQELGAFVSKPFTNWNKALDSLNHHADTKYHKFAVEQAANFIKVMEGKALDVSESINVENSKIAEENRRRLKAIVETILLCGRQEIALRGCRDSGEVGINEPAHNDGNFRALLRFRARSGDEALKNHLLTQNIHSRAMYTSSGIQNEVSELCGNAIQPHVLKRVKKAGFFTELTDETRDISRQDQLALCLRYVDCPSGKSSIMEDFLDFIYVEDVSAQALGNTIVTHLLSCNLDMDKLVGQGFDGAAIMSGQIRGVRTMIAEQYPTALFVHCVAHVLNLVLAHSCEIPMIRNCIGTIKSIVNFFRQSPLRDNLLKKISNQTESSRSTLISLCETRWTEKHVAVERFAEMPPVVCAILEDLQDAAKQMSSSDITVPRTTGRQTQRSNVPGETAEIYYRRNVFYPFLEHVVTEPDARFKPHEATIEEIQMLLPEKTNNDSRTKENLKKIAQTFLGENVGTTILSEYEIWHNHWKSVE
ncbi:zinc finger MYM-type protein 1-like [Schistocerca serialis cubense]|uniref:zinc finger MYM-type protein 1-like n=1 Tax=Schistocerca serialis cubense TaxID=2023355 RepID=UPI00214F1993|nr:zinc finger MYM-type protein 1-like [Schistocerca serialis cubense]